jgi:hypothetical protein
MLSAIRRRCGPTWLISIRFHLIGSTADQDVFREQKNPAAGNLGQAQNIESCDTT